MSAVIVGVGLVLALTNVAGRFASRAYMDVTSDIGMIVAALACAWRAAHLAGRARVGWALAAAGAASWSLGGVVWTSHEVFAREPAPFPGWSDLGFLGLPVLAGVGMLFLAGSWRGRSHVMRRTLDALIVAGSIALIEWTFVLGPAWEMRAGTFLEQAVSLAYPLGDLALVTLVLALLPGSSQSRALPVALLGTGLVLLAFADSAWLALLAAGLYESGGVTDVGWIAAPYLITLAALCPARAWVAPPAAGAARLRSAVAAGALVLVALVVAAIEFARTGTIHAFVLGAVLTLVVAIALRQLLALHDNLALTRELKRKAAEVEDAHARLAEVNERRKLFVSAVAHELATPLTPIKLQLYRMSSPTMGPLTDEQQHAMRIVSRNFDRLGALVQDLLDAARLEAGKLQLRPAREDLDRLVREATASFQEVAVERGVELSVVSAGPAWSLVDAARVSQVLFNLLGNAMRFAPPGGHVHVELVSAAESWVVEVTDDGAGLAPDQLDRLFQPFTQVHEQAGGTGLGLFISRGIIEGHGGWIGATSPGPGLGARFAFGVPSAPAPRPVHAPLGAPGPHAWSGAADG